MRCNILDRLSILIIIHDYIIYSYYNNDTQILFNMHYIKYQLCVTTQFKTHKQFIYVHLYIHIYIYYIDVEVFICNIHMNSYYGKTPLYETNTIRM